MPLLILTGKNIILAVRAIGNASGSHMLCLPANQLRYLMFKSNHNMCNGENMFCYRVFYITVQLAICFSSQKNGYTYQ